VSVVIVGVIRRKPVLTHASIVCEGMLASVNSVNKEITLQLAVYKSLENCVQTWHLCYQMDQLAR